MRIRTLTYALKQGFKNIRRNRMFSLASVGTIMACLLLFGIFYFIISNFQYMIKTAESSVGVTVFFDEGINEKQITAIGDKIQERKEVSKINFISAEEAWEKCQKDFFKEDIGRAHV